MVNSATDTLPTYTLPDSLFYRWSGSVVFPVNKYKLPDNDSVINELLDVVMPVGGRWQLVGIDLRGAASPEGPYYNNVRLATRRAEAIINLLAQQPGMVNRDILRVSEMPEDYDYLVRMMRDAGDADAERVADLVAIGDGNPANIKSLLRSADQGRLWRRLLKEYFPALRAARFVIFFRHRSEPIDVPVDVNSAIIPTDIGYLVPPRRPEAVDLPLQKSVWIDRRHVLSVSTNLIYDIFYMPGFGWAPMPNIGVEYYPTKGNWTLRGAFTFPYYHRWSRNKFFQIRDYHLEARMYLHPGMIHSGWYAGAYLNNTKYGIGLDARRGWQGEGLGAAVKAGYVMPLGHRGRWRLDLSLAVGAWGTRFDRYVYGNPVTGNVDGDYYYDYTGPASEFTRRNSRLWWFGPTEIGITLTYDLLYRRVQRRGVGVPSRELKIGGFGL